jgi:hypothetical protein
MAILGAKTIILVHVIRCFVLEISLVGIYKTCMHIISNMGFKIEDMKRDAYRNNWVERLEICNLLYNNVVLCSFLKSILHTSNLTWIFIMLWIIFPMGTLIS